MAKKTYPINLINKNIGLYLENIYRKKAVTSKGVRISWEKMIYRVIKYLQVKKIKNRDYLQVKKIKNRDYLQVKKIKNRDYLQVKKIKNRDYLQVKKIKNRD